MFMNNINDKNFCEKLYTYGTRVTVQFTGVRISLLTVKIEQVQFFVVVTLSLSFRFAILNSISVSIDNEV